MIEKCGVTPSCRKWSVFLFEFCNGHVHLRVKGECGWLEDRRGRLVLSVDNMKTSMSGREPLNGAAEPGPDLLEIDIFDVTKSPRTKNRCNAIRLETADRTFINFRKLFGPLLFLFVRSQIEARPFRLHAESSRQMGHRGLSPFAGFLCRSRTEKNLAHLARRTAGDGTLARPRQRFVDIIGFKYPE